MEVLFHRLASQEYLNALRWYARRSARVAQAFRDAVEQTVQRIAATPDQGSPFRTRFRYFRTRRFPYLLYYLPLNSTQIVVMAVAHARRRPAYWVRRRPGA
ncbi:MAG: type II toxin-antitoxin system RelE/ParE family toxin [Planctomycetes bacterium]|nr:type II toxin-antitoxin system RelE/ParE family toxin [Planctomycetota bacterium]